jgi:hypothetical protein
LLYKFKPEGVHHLLERFVVGTHLLKLLARREGLVLGAEVGLYNVKREVRIVQMRTQVAEDGLMTRREAVTLLLV